MKNHTKGKGPQQICSSLSDFQQNIQMSPDLKTEELVYRLVYSN